MLSLTQQTTVAKALQKALNTVGKAHVRRRKGLIHVLEDCIPVIISVWKAKSIRGIERSLI
jgi:hypothetical protein